MALTSKQRAMLRGLASKENVIVTVGKGGITENTVSEMNNALKARELVKGRVLETALLSAREASETLCESEMYLFSFGEILRTRRSILRKKEKYEDRSVWRQF